MSIAEFRKANPEYRIVNVCEAMSSWVPIPASSCKRATSSRLAAATAALTDKMGLIGPEVADARRSAFRWIRPRFWSPTRR